MGVLPILALGLFLGMRHATDADHVVAVTTIVSRERTTHGAMLIGAFWGLGHTLTIMVVGGAIIVFGVVIPPRVGLSMELTVAAMLIVLGLLNLTGAIRSIDAVAHAHSGPEREGVPGQRSKHVESARSILVSSQFLGPRGVRRPLRSLFVGIVHGLAGSAAVALLVLTTIREPLWALLYLGVFGLGTVVGMMLLTTAMSLPLIAAVKRVDSIGPLLARVTGVLSIAFGMLLTYQIGIADGLFTSHPIWIPK